MGRPLTAALNEQQRIIDSLRQTVAKQELVINYIAKVAGISPEVTEIRRVADLDNPAQPYPNPPEVAPSETTEQAATAEATDDPRNIGMTPGSVQGVPAATTVTPMDPGTTLPTSPFGDLTDVQAPVAGTQAGEVPLPQVRTEVDVRVGDPNNPEPAYPWTLDGNRTMASLRLARLRIQTGTETGDDISVSAKIEGDKSLSTEAINAEIDTLSSVVKAASRQAARPQNLVPRTAARMPVSMAQAPQPLQSTAAVTDADAEDLFL